MSPLFNKIQQYSTRVLAGVTLTAVVVFCIWIAAVQSATAPPIITYQGKLLESGASVTSTKNMAFLIYDDATAGSLLYTAAGTLGATSTISVSPNSGIFSVDLGDTGTNALSENIFRDESELYLEIYIEGVKLTPRKRLTSLPYSINSNYLQGYAPSITPTTTNYIPVSDASGTFKFTTTTITEQLNVERQIEFGTSTTQTIGQEDGRLTMRGDIDILGNVGAIKEVGFIRNGSPPGTVKIGNPRNVDVKGDYVYMVNSSFGSFTIIDAKDPKNPKQVNVIDNVNYTLGNAYDVVVSGNYAYVTANFNDVLTILDIRNPTDIIEVGSIENGVTATGIEEPRGLTVAGNYAYVTGYASHSLSIVDISNPAVPIEVGVIQDDTIPGGQATAIRSPYDVAVKGNYAYVLGWGEGAMGVINIQDPANPVQVAEFRDAVEATYFNRPSDIQIDGNYAYIAAGGGTSASLTIVDITDPINPIEVATVVDPNNVTVPAPTLQVDDFRGIGGVTIAGDYAYVTAFTSDAVHVINISNPNSPYLISTLKDDVSIHINEPLGLQVNGNYAYVTSYGDDALSIIDVSGVRISNTEIGSARVGNLQVGTEAAFDQAVDIRGGLRVGGGLSVAGPSSFFSPTSSIPTTNIFQVGTIGNLYLQINSGGDTNLFGDLLVSGAVSSTAYTLNGDTITAWPTGASSLFVDGGGFLTPVTSTNRLIIGSSTPSTTDSMLEVTGTSSFYGNMVADGNLSVSGQGSFLNGQALLGKGNDNLTYFSLTNTSSIKGFFALAYQEQGDLILTGDPSVRSSGFTIRDSISTSTSFVFLGVRNRAGNDFSQLRLGGGGTGFKSEIVLADETNSTKIRLGTMGIDNYISGANTYIGSSTTSSVHTNFTMDGDDLYVAGDVGVRGEVFARNGITVGTSSLRLTSGNGNSTISATDGPLSITANGEAVIIDSLARFTDSLTVDTGMFRSGVTSTRNLLMNQFNSSSINKFGNSSFEAYYAEANILSNGINLPYVPWVTTRVLSTAILAPTTTVYDGNYAVQLGSSASTTQNNGTVIGQYIIEEIDFDGSQLPEIAPNTDYTLSFYAKETNPGSKIRLMVPTIDNSGICGGSDTALYDFNTSNYTCISDGINLPTSTVGYAKDFNLTSSFSRYSVTFQSPNVSTTLMLPSLFVGGGALYADQSVVLDAAQLEKNGVASSYVNGENPYIDILIGGNFSTSLYSIQTEYDPQNIEEFIAISDVGTQLLSVTDKFNTSYFSVSSKQTRIGNSATGNGLLSINTGMQSGTGTIQFSGNSSVPWKLQYSKNNYNGAKISGNTIIEGTQFVELGVDNGGEAKLRIDQSGIITLQALGSSTSTLSLNQNGTIDMTGNVDINGSLEIDLESGAGTNNALCASTVGTTNITIMDCPGAPSDLAELYESNPSVEAGDIVMTTPETITYTEGLYDPISGAAIKKAPVVSSSSTMLSVADQAKKQTTISVVDKARQTSGTVLGVVSTNPAQVLGRIVSKYASNPQAVAITGRVPTKVNIENGTIAVGDMISLSSAAGVGMKARPGDATVGIALEPYSGGARNKIMIAIMPGQYGLLQKIEALEAQIGAEYGDTVNQNPEEMTVEEDEQTGGIVYTGGNLNLAGSSILNVQTIQGAEGKWRIAADGTVVSQIETSEGTKDLYALQSEKREIVLSGSAQLESGIHTVEFAPEYAEIIDADEPIKITVTLTDEANGVFVTDKSTAGFTVKELAGGTSDATFDWVAIVYKEDNTTNILPDETVDNEPKEEENDVENTDDEDNVSTTTPESGDVSTSTPDNTSSSSTPDQEIGGEDDTTDDSPSETDEETTPSEEPPEDEQTIPTDENSSTEDEGNTGDENQPPVDPPATSEPPASSEPESPPPTDNSGSEQTTPPPSNEDAA